MLDDTIVMIDKGGCIEKNKIIDIHNQIKYILLQRRDQEMKKEHGDPVVVLGVEFGYYVIRTLDFLKEYSAKPTSSGRRRLIDLFQEESVVKIPLQKVIDFLSVAREYIPILIQQKQNTLCSECFSTNMIEHRESSEMICEDCGLVYDNRTLGLRDMESINTCRSSYTLKANLLKAISKFEGNTTLQKSLVDKVRTEVEKRKISNLQNAHIIKILKDLRLSKYYEDVRTFLTILRGEQPASIQEYVPQILRLHDELEFAYNFVKDPLRINSLNVHFKLFKLLRLCNYKCHISDFCMLKTETKMEEHEEKWAEICKITGWTDN